MKKWRTKDNLKKCLKKSCSILLAVSLILAQKGISCISVEAEPADAAYVVMTEDEKTLTELMEEYAAEGAEDMETDTGVAVLELNPKEAKAIEKQDGVLLIEKDILLTASADATDLPEAESMDATPYQWNLSAIHWDAAQISENHIRIALLDSGVLWHEDIDIAADIRCLEEDMDVSDLYLDTSGHGTALASIIAGKHNEIGISGINPNADIYSIKVLNGENQARLSTVVKGIYAAIENDCQIINMSFGTSVDSDILHTAIRDAYDAGILMIGAAGNTQGAAEYPAAYDEVMAVGATDASGQWMEDTASGGKLEILAPGDRIVADAAYNSVVVTSGTSLAAAQVTGAASVLWAQNPEKPADYIRRLLSNTAQHTSGNMQAGLLDIENSMEQNAAFSACYQPGQVIYQSVQESCGEAGAYDAEGLVNGSWGYENHQTQVANVSSKFIISASNLRLMQETVKIADNTDPTQGPKYHDAKMLHGYGNYVKALQFLFMCGHYLKYGWISADAVNQAAAGVGLSNTKGSQERTLKEYTLLMLQSSVVPNLAEGTPEARYYKVMGFAAHLIGDIYAHRTMVPTYTIKGTNPTKHVNSTGAETARFGTGDFKTGSHTVMDDATLKVWAANSSSQSENICKYWKCFQRAVALKVVEFRDIANFVKPEKEGAHSIYEDNTHFCSERFSESQEAINRILNTPMFNPMEILHPDTLKLNKFKLYCEQIGAQNISAYDAYWGSWSTGDGV